MYYYVHTLLRTTSELWWAHNCTFCYAADDEVWKSLHTQQDLVRFGISDIYDGAKYKELHDFVSPKPSVTLVLNTDSVQLFKSSTVSLWPVWLAICELPRALRFSKKNTVLAALWVGKVKPTMVKFLNPLTESLHELYHSGIRIKVRSKVIDARAAVVTATLDLPARASVMNMLHFNGHSACHLCEQTGTNVRLHRWWTYTPNPKPQSHTSILQNAQEATIFNKIEKGVKGASILFKLPRFDVCRGVVIDSLHCIYLGVTLHNYA